MQASTSECRDDSAVTWESNAAAKRSDEGQLAGPAAPRRGAAAPDQRSGQQDGGRQADGGEQREGIRALPVQEIAVLALSRRRSCRPNSSSASSAATAATCQDARGRTPADTLRPVHRLRRNSSVRGEPEIGVSRSTVKRSPKTSRQCSSVTHPKRSCRKRSSRSNCGVRERHEFEHHGLPGEVPQQVAHRRDGEPGGDDEMVHDGQREHAVGADPVAEAGRS